MLTAKRGSKIRPGENSHPFGCFKADPRGPLASRIMILDRKEICYFSLIVGSVSPWLHVFRGDHSWVLQASEDSNYKITCLCRSCSHARPGLSLGSKTPAYSFEFWMSSSRWSKVPTCTWTILWLLYDIKSSFDWLGGGTRILLDLNLAHCSWALGLSTTHIQLGATCVTWSHYSVGYFWINFRNQVIGSHTSSLQSKLLQMFA